MAVYIKDCQFKDTVTINKYILEVGAYLRGEEIIKYSSFDQLTSIHKNDIVCDYINETRYLLNLMNISIPDIDYPKSLSTFFGREIKEGMLGQIVNIPENWGSFIKPKVGSKSFTGRVVNNTRDLIGIGLSFDYPIWISEVVDFVAEWRCFVLEGQVIDVRPYKGDYHYCYDASIIDLAIATWLEAPIAYSLDIGVTKDGRTLIVEVNDGFALGFYGLDPSNAIKFHTARWREMTEPYFSKHEVFYF